MSFCHGWGTLDERVGISADGIFTAWNWDVRVCLSSYSIAIVLCRVVYTRTQSSMLMLLYPCYYAVAIRIELGPATEAEADSASLYFQ